MIILDEHVTFFWWKKHYLKCYLLLFDDLQMRRGLLQMFLCLESHHPQPPDFHWRCHVFLETPANHSHPGKQNGINKKFSWCLQKSIKQPSFMTSEVGTPCRCRPTTLLLENQVPLILGDGQVVENPMGFIDEFSCGNYPGIGISEFVFSWRKSMEM